MQESNQTVRNTQFTEEMMAGRGTAVLQFWRTYKEDKSHQAAVEAESRTARRNLAQHEEKPGWWLTYVIPTLRRIIATLRSAWATE